MAERKPLIVLGVLAVVAIIVYLVAVVGAGRDTAADPWPDWATPGFSPGDPLTAEITGGWPWQSATRRALLVVTAGPVDLGVTLAGKALRTGLDPGDDIRLTYTREGGDFALACANLAGCAVVLTEDS